MISISISLEQIDMGMSTQYYFVLSLMIVLSSQKSPLDLADMTFRKVHDFVDCFVRATLLVT